MSGYDILVSNGMLVSGRSVVQADIGILDGRIAAIGELRGSGALRVIDAGGRYVLPGVIDVHNHPVYADDMVAMTRAGATRGVTTVIPHIGAFPAWGFPKSSPLAVIRDFAAQWNGHVPCDFGVHAAIDAEDDLGAEIDDLITFGVCSFKFFMAYKQRGMMSDDGTLIRNFDIVSSRGGLAMVHAENGPAISYLEGRDWDAEEVANGRFVECHTDLLEAEAVLRAIALADAVDCPIYIPHLAARESLEAVQLARRSTGIPIAVESCPHYLMLGNEEVLRRGALSKIAPPLREGNDQEALWGALAGDEIQVIASDHSPRTLEAKTSAKNLLQAPFGSESIEHVLQLMYSEGVRRGRITICQLVKLLSETPADLFGLTGRKGRILPGADADLVVFNPEREETLGKERHLTNADYCLYEGWECVGAAELTMLRGEVTFDADGQTTMARSGRFVPGRRASKAT
jgi:dihydropyrimidinase